jgi:hypothetical protein
VLLIGGLIVSTKIGGGDDLHNLDAYLTHLMVIGLYFIFDRFVADGEQQTQFAPIPWQWVIMVLIFPMFFAIGLGEPSTPVNHQLADDALEDLQSAVTLTVESGGEVLFISERHLLTFHLIRGVNFEPRYEKTFLMEMAMSENQAYFDTFETDLQNKTFDLIISNPQRKIYKGRDYTFGEEDDAWVKYVSTLLLDYYQTVQEIDTGASHLALMEPKP